MKLGFIGSGKIASSVITGICNSKISFSRILISSRNIKIANNLKKKLLRKLKKHGKKAEELISTIKFILERKF